MGESGAPNMTTVFPAAMGARIERSPKIKGAFLHFLCKHPGVLRNVVQELQRTFSTYEEIRTGTRLGSCVWLKSSIDEAMRLSTPAPAPIPREVLPGGITVGGRVGHEGEVGA